MIEWQEVFVQHNVIITYLMTSLLCQYDVILIQEVPAAETFDFFSISILRNIMEQIFFRQDANKISSFQDLDRIQNVKFRQSNFADPILRLEKPFQF